MKICDELTNPEDSAERTTRRRVLAEITARGGCALCVNRDRNSLAWGRYTCSGDPARVFPACTTDGKAPTFELDESRLREATK